MCVEYGCVWSMGVFGYGDIYGVLGFYGILGMGILGDFMLGYVVGIRGYTCPGYEEGKAFLRITT